MICGLCNKCEAYIESPRSVVIAEIKKIAEDYVGCVCAHCTSSIKSSSSGFNDHSIDTAIVRIIYRKWLNSTYSKLERKDRYARLNNIRVKMSDIRKRCSLLPKKRRIYNDEERKERKKEAAKKYQKRVRENMSKEERLAFNERQRNNPATKVSGVKYYNSLTSKQKAHNKKLRDKRKKDEKANEYN